MEPKPPPAEEVALAEGLRRRDPEVFAAVVRRYAGFVLHKARTMLGNPTGGEDAAQEVFLKAFREMQTLRGVRVGAWLAAITYHHCLDLLRQQQRAPRAVALDEQRDPAVDPPALDGIDHLLTGLSPTERMVVVLRIVEHYEYQDIADITGLAVGTLRNMLSASLRRLREEMDRHGL
jgi:RNA polymerase sigma-70 factor (ECF subfamily)